MNTERSQTWMTYDDPLAKSVVQAIRTGDVPGLTELLAGNPGLATARIVGTEEGRASNEGTGGGETGDAGNTETVGVGVSNTGASSEGTGNPDDGGGVSYTETGSRDTGNANSGGDAGASANGKNTGGGTESEESGAKSVNPGSTDRGMSRTLLHIATDWPGHYPNNAAVVGVLIEAGAEVNAQFSGGTARRRCTGQQAAMTPRCWTCCSMPVPTSRPQVRSSPAAPRWTMLWPSRSGGRRSGWWSAVRSLHYGTRRRLVCLMRWRPTSPDIRSRAAILGAQALLQQHRTR